MIGVDKPNVTLSAGLPNSTLPIIGEVQGQVFPNEKTEKIEKANLEEKKSRKVDGYFVYIYEEINATTQSVTLRELRHFSSYTISVRACRESEPNDESSNCSTEVIAYQRTGKMSKYTLILLI